MVGGIKIKNSKPHGANVEPMGPKIEQTSPTAQTHPAGPMGPRVWFARLWGIFRFEGHMGPHAASNFEYSSPRTMARTSYSDALTSVHDSLSYWHRLQLLLNRFSGYSKFDQGPWGTLLNWVSNGRMKKS